MLDSAKRKTEGKYPNEETYYRCSHWCTRPSLQLLGNCRGKKRNRKIRKNDSSPISAHAIEAPMPAIPAGLEKFYSQKPAWKECGHGLDCATVTVPLNYADPEGAAIELKIKRRKAEGTRIGSLLVNPGGPGGSGQEMAESAPQFFTDRITDSFDIIGFDPRGVGESTPIDCVTDRELDQVLSTVYADTPEGQAQSRASEVELANKCVEKSGNLVKYVGTEEAARDMDVLRHLMGDPKLYYVGFSYGTKLGGMYAELFPHNVGRLILDGAVDSDVSDFEQSKAQLKGFELAANNFIDKCLKAKHARLKVHGMKHVKKFGKCLKKQPTNQFQPQTLNVLSPKLGSCLVSSRHYMMILHGRFSHKQSMNIKPLEQETLSRCSSMPIPDVILRGTTRIIPSNHILRSTVQTPQLKAHPKIGIG